MNAAHLQRGRFITFEGGEGAGKSTQIAELANRLREEGIDVVTTREPGGSALAEALRAVLLSGAARDLGPEGEAVLFAAARADHVDRTIRPALMRGSWVLCDRFADSTRVYQGVADAVPGTIVRALEDLALDGVKPDLTVLIDVPAEIGVARADRRRGDTGADRFEGDAMAVHERRRQAFLALAAAEPERFVVIDGSEDAATVSERVWSAAVARLARHDPART